MPPLSKENIAPQLASAPPTPPPEQPGPSKHLRILLLEDVESDAELLQHELRKSKIPFSCRCVETRADFLDSLRDFAPDIVLSDFSMPQFNAMDALHLLHDSPHDVPFILVTGSQSEEVAVACMKEGVDDYILKTSLKRLPSAVLNALQKQDAERERERARVALQRSEEHFRSLIENALDIITVLSPEGYFRYASPSVRGLGFKPEDLVGKSIFGFVNPDDAREVSDILNNTLQHPGEVRTFEFLFRHADGSWRVLEAIGKTSSEARLSGIVLNARDVSERKQAEVAIEKLAAFPRLNPNPIFELNADGHLTYFNQAAEAMAKSLGKTPAEMLPPDGPQIVRECLASGANNFRRETTIGNRILAWSFFPIIPTQAVHCYAVDMTERLNLESQLRQSQKMESIGQLAAGVAHDFNNILTIIQGYSGLLLARKDLPPDYSEPIEQMSLAAERASSLTKQLLMFSRKQVMQPQDLDLNDVISHLTKLLRRVLGEDITLHFNYSPDVPLVLGDSGMIEQVLVNLAVNARDAMLRGGRLSIGTEPFNITPEYIRANPEARLGHYVCLRISDSGCGISQENLAHIFEPFFTTKEIGKGTGLGLATVYGIIKQHSGWIEVLSELGRGTTFRIFLPASNAERAVGTIEPDTRVRGGTERILIAEDEPELRSLVREILENYGYQISEAGSGPEALRIWEKNSGQFDMLLTDIVMPGNMTGRELGDKLKAAKPNLRILYTSGYSVDMMEKDFTLNRGINFLQKPYHPLLLVRMVRDCLDTCA